MWVRVQKKDILIECKFIYLSEAIFNKSKISVKGSFLNAAELGGSILGEYDSFEEAKRIFEDIQSNIAEGKNLYIMP